MKRYTSPRFLIKGGGDAMDILTLIIGLSTTWKVIGIAIIIIWLSLCYRLSGYTEKHWGDRETGAVIGFFVPMLILMFWLGH